MNTLHYLCHAYLSFIDARGRHYPMSLIAFGHTVPQTLNEYEIELVKRTTENIIQTNLELSKDCGVDWLSHCDVYAR